MIYHVLLDFIIKLIQDKGRKKVFITGKKKLICYSNKVPVSWEIAAIYHGRRMYIWGKVGTI